jgi:hypothetical protein
MKRSHIVFWFLLACTIVTCSAFAQDSCSTPVKARNTISAELGGKGILYTVYYERMLSDRLSANIGFSQWRLELFWSTDLLLVPVFLTWYPVGDEHHLYIDAGAEYIRFSHVGLFDLFEVEGEAHTFAGVFGAGYAYRSNDGGLCLKVGPMAFVGSGGGAMWAGLSLGVSF